MSHAFVPFAFSAFCAILVVSESNKAHCKSMHACSRGNLQFVLNHRMAHDRRCQCITIKSESVPSEKNVPSILATSHPRTPIDAKLVASRAEVGRGFSLRKSRSILVRGRYATGANFARVGPRGHSQGVNRENIEGTFFSLGTGRDSILTTQAHASEEILQVLWRHGPFAVLSSSVKHATTTLMPREISIERQAQDDA